MYFFFIRYRSSLPYSKALYKRKLISIKKWLQSTDYKNIAKVPFPFINTIYSLITNFVSLSMYEPEFNFV